MLFMLASDNIFDIFLNISSLYRDLIHKGNIKMNTSHASLSTLMSVINKYDIKTEYVQGNHDILNFERRSSDKHYDTFKIGAYKFISIDCYDIAMIGYPKYDSRYVLASGMRKHKHRRFYIANGAVSVEQLNWLDSELSKSDSSNERAIIYGHCCITLDNCDISSMIWNHDAIVRVLKKHPSAILYLNGHSHERNHSKTPDNFNYIVFDSVVETPRNVDAHSTITIRKDTIFVEGDKSFELRARGSV